MKAEARKWLARAAFVALVAAGTLVAGARLNAAVPCPDPSPGTCPPLLYGQGEGSCYEACRLMGWLDGGQCPPAGSGCCVCFM